MLKLCSIPLRCYLATIRLVCCKICSGLTILCDFTGWLDCIVAIRGRRNNTQTSVCFLRYALKNSLEKPTWFLHTGKICQWILKNRIHRISGEYGIFAFWLSKISYLLVLGSSQYLGVTRHFKSPQSFTQIKLSNLKFFKVSKFSVWLSRVKSSQVISNFPVKSHFQITKYSHLCHLIHFVVVDI